MHLTASNSWAKPWPTLKLVTIYKSTWVILLTGFGRKVILEKSVSRCISPPSLNTSLYSTTLQTPQPAQQGLPLDLPVLHRHSTLDSRLVPQGVCSSEPFSPQKRLPSAPYCTAIGIGGSVSLTCWDTAALTLPQKRAGQERKSRETEAQW